MPTRKAKASKAVSLSKANVSQTRSFAQPALFSLKGLAWKEGSGPLRGVQVAVVSEDRKSGSKAMFMRISGKSPEDRLHYHTLPSHTLVIEGSITTSVNGKRITLKAGDYFRCPANWLHADSGGGGTIFTVIEDNPSPASGVATKFDVISVQ